MAKTFEDVLKWIRETEDEGVSQAAIIKKWPGTSGKQKKACLDDLNKKLASAVREGVIQGPFKKGNSKLYFAAGRGPTLEKVTAQISELVLTSGVRLLSKAGVETNIKDPEKGYVADALRNAVSERLIIELTSGKSKLYLHRDVAAEMFGFKSETQPGDPPGGPTETTKFGWSDFLPIYRRLKAEQGGFSSVNIYDVIRASGAGKLAVHKLLIAEAKTGRAAIHPTTSVELPREVIEAGIRLDGFPETFITVTVNDN